ncbi:MAG: GNAT family N-acetyltransferase, partial [Candidatus Aenigmarchaeota archaeon]|nr:GNAT family N-acetyltransferase [Candidatus Aenigmarchaeota archaeon]
QIGLMKKIIFFQLPVKSFYMINPKISWRSEEIFPVWDSCFSFDVAFFVKIKRHKKIRVKYQDELGIQKVEVFEDNLSELFQHEIDHLQGIIATDYLTDVKQIIMREEWGKISRFEYRIANINDIEKMKKIIFIHGKNKWNHLPKSEVSNHLEAIKEGKTQALVATDNGEIIGFITFLIGNIFPKYDEEVHGYIAEAVICDNYKEQGIGTKLLKSVKDKILEKGINHIFILRHEENIVSAKMMEKSGFNVLETFYDPTRRTFGSKRTTVCQFVREPLQ